ncbi:HTH-type transcriptional repressor AcnR [Halomicronema hongdechloris C2206]|uniref:HTH-type transcriptional repressor AcnR n=1 Tax=Halomicronema hongdechloris C2206 TaxID=1641165 RepID=A0A1Z3HTW4_9CYAN|nr:TetR/AcrR family transcriptional regulator [Halomicronema hongdechloris]ASC73567.1 HTH-type transcriptional repressor AcnR [Halomicronema hongdechloris C2206]
MGTLPTPSTATQLKQEQILQGALTIFLQQGYEGTSMDRVASAAGVSKITIYKHFQDKEGLFTALIDWVTTQRFQIVFGALSLEDPPEVVLRRVATRLLDMLAVDEEYIAFLRLIIGESGRFPAIAQRFIQVLPKKVLRVLTRYFQAHPELKFTDPEAAARIFVGSLITYVMTQKLLHGQSIIPMQQDVLIDSVIDMIVRYPGPATDSGK